MHIPQGTLGLIWFSPGQLLSKKKKEKQGALVPCGKFCTQFSSERFSDLLNYEDAKEPIYDYFCIQFRVQAIIQYMSSFIWQPKYSI